MPRQLRVAAAQLGPNQEGTPREAVVARMLGLLEQAPPAALPSAAGGRISVGTTTEGEPSCRVT